MSLVRVLGLSNNYDKSGQLGSQVTLEAPFESLKYQMLLERDQEQLSLKLNLLQPHPRSQPSPSTYTESHAELGYMRCLLRQLVSQYSMFASPNTTNEFFILYLDRTWILVNELLASS